MRYVLVIEGEVKNTIEATRFGTEAEMLATPPEDRRDFYVVPDGATLHRSDAQAEAGWTKAPNQDLFIDPRPRPSPPVPAEPPKNLTVL